MARELETPDVITRQRLAFAQLLRDVVQGIPPERAPAGFTVEQDGTIITPRGERISPPGEKGGKP